MDQARADEEEGKQINQKKTVMTIANFLPLSEIVSGEKGSKKIISARAVLPDFPIERSATKCYWRNTHSTEV